MLKVKYHVNNIALMESIPRDRKKSMRTPFKVMPWYAIIHAHKHNMGLCCVTGSKKKKKCREKLWILNKWSIGMHDPICLAENYSCSFNTSIKLCEHFWRASVFFRKYQICPGDGFFFTWLPNSGANDILKEKKDCWLCSLPFVTRWYQERVALCKANILSMVM